MKANLESKWQPFYHKPWWAPILIACFVTQTTRNGGMATVYKREKHQKPTHNWNSTAPTDRVGHANRYRW